jgi:hypothetical protein
VWAGDPDIPEGDNEASSDRQGLRRSIVSMSILSWFIREINDGAFSIFHLISIQTLLFIAVGLAFLFLGRPIRHWYVWHLRFMLYSYVTLIVTGIAQALEYLPFTSDVVNAVVFLQIPAVVGWFLIEFRGTPRWRAQFGSHPDLTSKVSR